VEHLEEGAAVFLRHPLFGVGINNSSAVREVVAADNLTNEEHNVAIHSAHLAGLAETGLIGYALYVGFFIRVAVEAFRKSRSKNFCVRTFSIAVLGAYAAISVHMMTDYLGTEAHQVMLWLYAGFIVGQMRVGQMSRGDVATTARWGAGTPALNGAL